MYQWEFGILATRWDNWKSELRSIKMKEDEKVARAWKRKMNDSFD
jgi:hypothetical protein